MANPERGEVGVTVGGKQYTLRPTFDSLVELEALIGKVDVIDAFRQGFLSGTRAVVWCLLNDEHADEIKTLKDASKWIEKAGGLDVVQPLIQRVLGLNEPPEEVKATAEEDPQAAQVGTGEPSLPALVATV